MIQILDKVKCTGCSACAASCPKNCITMEPDSEGFLYPSVDSSSCINCGSCEKTCPVMNTHFIPRDDFPEAYLVYAKDSDLRQKSAAGGGFAAIARMYMEKYNGIAFGAAYDDSYCVKHIGIENKNDLKKLQKSKYVQSEIGNSYLLVKQKLLQREYVLFSGTPCQIYGLKSFLKGVNQDRLLCVDLSCHGVPSPLVFQKYLEYLKDKYGNIKSFMMRDKRYKSFSYDQGFGIEFENGQKMFNSHSSDLFGRCFWGEIASRPSCYSCHFKTVWRQADITLGDCWFFDCYAKGESDTMGVTLALIHSEKGKTFITNNPFLKTYQVPSEEIIKANGGMIYSSANPHPKRSEFFRRLKTEDFEELVNDCLPQKHNKKRIIMKLLSRYGGRVKLLRMRVRRKRLEERTNRTIPNNAIGEMK